MEKPFTLFVRDLATGLTSFHHVTAAELADANEKWESDYPGTELIGGIAGHVTPLWWEV